MTSHIKIPDIVPIVRLVGNGTQTVFEFPFPVFASEDVSVYLNGAYQTNGFNVDAAETGIGGVVTFSVAPANGVQVTLERRMPFERLTDFIEGGDFAANTLNTELDFLVAGLQQVERDQSSMLRFNPYETPVTPIIPDRDTPVAQGASGALDTLMEAFGKGEISPEQLTEINRHVEKMQELESSERKDSITQINESLRTEVASSDPYVRRMRPTFGYIIALTWAAQMFSIAYVIVFETNQAALVIEAVQSLGTIWAVGLSVLGIYVYKRSEEKKMDTPPLIFSPRSEPKKIFQKYNG